MTPTIRFDAALPINQQRAEILRLGLGSRGDSSAARPGKTTRIRKI
jgi:hypothetical protein